MEKLLEHINVKNTRISAVDGKVLDPNQYDHAKLSNGEIACCLSHIKAISYLSKLDGDYFLIMEDDVSLANSLLFDKTLDDIIDDCLKTVANFDILMIQKTYNKELKNTYTKWTHESEIYSTASYIISRDAVKKFISNTASMNDDLRLNYLRRPLEVADEYIYKYLETYVYKYNYVNTLDETSLIHNDHLSSHKKSSEVQLAIICQDMIQIDKTRE
ncbi:putative glycosyltransferase [Yasminevirus sp. GU-2018]|uniref:Putative glycosyltransferase n=1 Tax=Yasminevirus sp. GU-2018 TaxID=2420051 RepID=A0A5K0U856_9VIRU|nr:putative glycosyltransferase [Yasminevirus sp. GU-2018]